MIDKFSIIIFCTNGTKPSVLHVFWSNFWWSEFHKAFPFGIIHQILSNLIIFSTQIIEAVPSHMKLHAQTFTFINEIQFNNTL